jgi:hypothetical protein
VILTSCWAKRQETVLQTQVSRPNVILQCAARTGRDEHTRHVNVLGQDVATRDNKLHMKLFGQSDADVTVRDLPGSEVAVEIEVSPPQTFRKSPRLEMNFQHCTDAELGSRSWSIWRETATGRYEELDTDFDRGDRRATTHINHNSTYMIAD